MSLHLPVPQALQCMIKITYIAFTPSCKAGQYFFDLF